MTFQEKRLILVFISVAVVFQLAAFFPSFQESMAKIFSTSEDRVILAKVDGALRAGQPTLRFVKFIKGDLIHLEAYLLTNSDSGSNSNHFQKNGTNSMDIEHTLLGTLRLAESRDAYLTVKESATNLALSDVDMDGEFEILIPTFDNELVPRLHAYKFNLDYNTFEAIY